LPAISQKVAQKLIGKSQKLFFVTKVELPKSCCKKRKKKGKILKTTRSEMEAEGEEQTNQNAQIRSFFYLFIFCNYFYFLFIFLFFFYCTYNTVQYDTQLNYT